LLDELELPSYETPVPGVWQTNFLQFFSMDRGTYYAVCDGPRMADRILSKLNGTPRPRPSEEQAALLGIPRGGK